MTDLLEPDAVKVARPVLRGEGSSDALPPTRHGEPTVVVVGDAAPTELDERLRRMLSLGRPAVLPQEVITLLTERGIAERRKGPWREGHYRPGKQLI